MKKYRIYRILLPLLGGLLFSGCGKKSASENSTAIDLTAEIAKSTPVEIIDINNLPPATPTPTPAPVPESVDISLMMVGDNLLHTGMILSGKQDDGTYNYDFEFEDIKPFLDAADISIINQETPFGGDDREFTSYPTFNSPTAVGDAEAKAGFDVVLAATNHAYDQGISGLLHFADFFRDKHPEILLCGIHGSEADSEAAEAVTGELAGPPSAEQLADTTKPSIMVKCSNDRINLLDCKGYTFAFLNYTYSHNWESVAADAIGHLDFLCPYDPNTRKLTMTEVAPQVLDDIREAKEIADVVVVCPHWGVEYTFTQMPYQTTMAKQMIDAGADLIIGAHPHVVEPVEWVTTDSGNEALVYYSLGNYVSTQDYPERVYEAMAWVQFRDEGDGLKVVREESGALSMINHYTYGPMRFGHVYLLEDYSEELCATHGLVPRTGRRPKMSDFESWEQQLLGDFALKRADVLGNTE